MHAEAPNVDDGVVELTLSQRVARANASSSAVHQDDGSIVIELTVHPLESAALPRPGWEKQTLLTKLRRVIAKDRTDVPVRYVKMRGTDS